MKEDFKIGDAVICKANNIKGFVVKVRYGRITNEGKYYVLKVVIGKNKHATISSIKEYMYLSKMLLIEKC